MTHVQREFAHAFNGFDRNQVADHLANIEATLHRLLSERDSALSQVKALSAQVETVRAENSKLTARVEELAEPPKSLDDLDRRMQRVGQLAHLKAEEVTSRAQTATEESWKSTAQASIKLRERYRTLLKELDAHAEAMHSEHRAALEETRNEVQQLTVEAVRRRDRLDAEAERKRRAIEAEFDANMAKERAALEKYIADQRTASKQQAERRMQDAAVEARRLVAEATQEAHRRTTEADGVIERLANISADASKRLRAADELLTRGEKTMQPFEEELLPVLRAEDMDLDGKSSPDTPDARNNSTDNGSSKSTARAKADEQQADKPAPRPHAKATAGGDTQR